MGTIPGSPLGKATHYSDAYDPGLLYPVERSALRDSLQVGADLPFHGGDRWTAWEVSWLDATGRPRVAIATFDVPADSPRIVESKSLKLYLTAMNGSRFEDAAALRCTLAADLARAVGAAVDAQVTLPDGWKRYAREELAGQTIDDQELRSAAQSPDAALLRTGRAMATETLVSRVFRSLCPVTGQPDYAHVQVGYTGPVLDRGSLFAYLVAFRHHPGFHEHCVERIFVDVQRACAPSALTVLARFTRRGGIDINPWRSNVRGFHPDDRPVFQQ